MAPRNHKNWLSTPKVEFISSECYNNHSIYQQEIEQIFSKVWVPVCHKSEMANKGDFRSAQIAHQNVVAVNRGDLVKRFCVPRSTVPQGTVLTLTVCISCTAKSSMEG
jgi:methanesulfonate monooxygenase large subunit